MKLKILTKLRLAFLALIFLSTTVASAQQKVMPVIANLHEGEMLNGFKATAVYLNGAGKPMGARFIHVATGFTLDLLNIESVPQSFIWVNTFPVSDKGEPHTQEHLLITKGNKGRQLNTREGMSAAKSNAFTSQLHTVYDFYTDAGKDVFFTLFEKYLDALLNPDYTDQEVKREVRNWGVAQAADKSYYIEEKGSVYTEMNTTMNDPGAIMFDRIGRIVYGPAHPQSFNSGGLPAGIRELTAKEIAAFHQQNYYLGNMGAITALPGNVSLTQALTSVNAILQKLKGKGEQTARAARTLPPAKPAAPGTTEMVNVPSENAQQPGSMIMTYPANLKLNLAEQLELSNFLSCFAGDATTNLYKLFVDGKTHIPGFAAQNVSGWVDNNMGNAVNFYFDGVNPEYLTIEKSTQIKQAIRDEFNKIAAFKDNSPELKEFNKRYENSLISLVRYQAKLVNTPPKFGFRNTYDEWYDNLNMLNKESGFKKSVTFAPEIADIRKRMNSGINIWKSDLAKWNLTTATPYAVVSKADLEMNKQKETERKARVAAEVSRLKEQYHVTDDQAAIARYKADYDATTGVMEKREQSTKVSFIEHPPLTLDDQLHYKQIKIAGSVPAVVSTFENMNGGTVGLALNLHSVKAEQLVYLAILPDLLTGSGVIRDGSVSYEEMSQRIQREILSLNSYYSTNPITGRDELVVKAAGNNEQEALRAITWIDDVLSVPNWTGANLSRLRDMVQQDLSQLRKTMQGPEEAWVNDPGQAYRSQNDLLYLSTSSVLTREHNLLRLKWMLQDAGSPADNAALNRFLLLLADAKGDREKYNTLLQTLSEPGKVTPAASGFSQPYADAFNALSENAKKLATAAVVDLRLTISNIPDASLMQDWKYLCQTIAHDLMQTPAKTLDELNALRESLLKKDNVRAFIIGSSATTEKLTAALQPVFGSFKDAPSVKQTLKNTPHIEDRVKERMPLTGRIVFGGLINPDSHTGVIINYAPLVTYKDTTKTQLLQYLAGDLYAGAGSQSIYTKVVASGLSYGGGVYANPNGLVGYFAQKTPDLPQTLSFVINEIKRTPIDTGIVDYVVSIGVGGSRGSSDYEVRGEGMAANYADDITPELVKTFRLAILKLRKQPGLVNDIYKYKDFVYEKYLPGYGIASKDVPGATYFVIGPEKQMVSYEAYLKSVDGKDATLYRLYPRDFWITNGN